MPYLSKHDSLQFIEGWYFVIYLFTKGWSLGMKEGDEIDSMVSWQYLWVF